MDQADKTFQVELLQGVARSFALTIPQLPDVMAGVVANAYLLCRIADTIEDETTPTLDEKRELAALFIQVVSGQADAKSFTDRFMPMLSDQRLPAERELIQQTARLVSITHRFTLSQQENLQRCVTKMSKGMIYYQAHCSVRGFASMQQLDNYCYHVAGVVGEMLTELWCENEEALAAQKDRLLSLSQSFGQGLQMTNILKDINEDHARGVCWLPRDVFAHRGYDLDDLSIARKGSCFATGVQQLIAVSRGHLDQAAEYIAHIPSKQRGLRKFCLWAVAMALLTLRNISRNPEFDAAAQIKIGKSSVLAVIALSKVVYRSQWLTRLALAYWGRRLPVALPSKTDAEHDVVANWFERQPG